MRDNYPRERTSVLTWLMSAIVAGFVLQTVMGRVFNTPGMVEHAFQLSGGALRSFRIWTLLSYSFLHDIDNLLYVVGSLFALYFLGRAIEPMLGWKRFLGLYAGLVFAGGLAWTALHWNTGGALMGASSAVFGLFVVYACFFPVQPVTFLLFFVLPVTLKPRPVAIALAIFDLTGCLFYEVVGAASPFHFAHSAHLGAMAAGWVYFRYLHEAKWRLPKRRPDIELPRWARKQAKAPAPVNFQVNLEPPLDVRAEVDRILDKINSQGFGALSADEKRLLDEAKDLLSRP
ncbi:MAG: Rhomboid family protein [Verrucomicrobia bacterium]|nr:Rhomboid family protein [Verrucomicrobiota bacterium]